MYFLGILVYMKNIRFKLEEEDCVEGGLFPGFTSPEDVSDTVRQNRISPLRQRPAAVLR